MGSGGPNNGDLFPERAKGEPGLWHECPSKVRGEQGLQGPMAEHGQYGPPGPPGCFC